MSSSETSSSSSSSSKNRIAFGSCNNQNLTNPLWQIITKRNPDVFVWAGDAIYADKFQGFNYWPSYSYPSFPPKPIYHLATPQTLRQNYQQQKSNSSYIQFLKETNVTIIGTFDDHDYGQNNGDFTYPYKKESAIAFIDFIGEAIGKDGGLMYDRAQAGYGVYGVKVFDFSRDGGGACNDYLLSDFEAGIDADLPNMKNGIDDDNDNNNDNDDEFTCTIKSSLSSTSERKVAIFMLDVRSNKTPWYEGFQSFIPNYEGDFLGEKQWQWFEKSIQKSDAAVNIIVSGLQVHSYRFMSSNSAELWSNFPTARQRLYDTILQDNVQSPILISGDVHMTQLMRKDCFRRDDMYKRDVQSRPIVEFTTSGMTHSWGSCIASSDRFHKSPWKYHLCNIIGHSFMSLMHKVFPMPDLMEAKDMNKQHDGFFVDGGAENAKSGKQFSLQLNFGEIEIDWKERVLKIRAIGKDENDPPLLSASYSFDQLTGRQQIPGVKDLNSPINYDHLKYFMDGNLTSGRYTCFNNGDPAYPVQAILGLLVATIYLFSIVVLPHFLLILGIKKLLARKKKKKKRM